MAARQGYEFPGLKKAPSEYFRRNMYLTFIDEPDVVGHARNILGIKNIMWSSDYPHPVSSWPKSRAIAEEIMTGVSDEDRELVLSGNAARVWNL
jgi:predicted TIM-barrel fold metal-dependent hydrolase